MRARQGSLAAMEAEALTRLRKALDQEGKALALHYPEEAALEEAFEQVMADCEEATITVYCQVLERQPLDYRAIPHVQALVDAFRQHRKELYECY